MRGQSTSRLAALPPRPAGSSPSVAKIIRVCLADGAAGGMLRARRALTLPGLCTLPALQPPARLPQHHQSHRAPGDPRDPLKFGSFPASPSCIPIPSGRENTAMLLPKWEQSVWILL